MKHPFNTFVVAAAAAAIVAAASPASADPVKCHAAIGKNITKYQATLAKNSVGCHKSRLGGKVLPAVDCNDAVGADIKLKRTGARQKAIDGIKKACVIDLTDDGNDETTVRALYSHCPSPVSASDDGGATTGIDTFTELATCLLDLSEDYNEKITDELLGNPTVPASEAGEDCVLAVGKTYSKAVKTIGGNRHKCHNGAEKTAAGLVPYGGSSCATGDSSGKIGPAITAITTAINTSCTSALLPTRADWTALGVCAAREASPTQADFVACGVTKVASPVGNGIAGAAQELPAQSCAGVADVIINSGFGEKLTNSRLDSGWKGTAHYVDIIDQSFGAVTLSNCDDDCKNCDVDHNPKNDNCRCDSDATAVCDVNNGPDVDDCGGGNCTCMFGPPLAISASATPVCVVNRFTGDFTGSTAEVGEYSVGTSTRALVHTGISQVQPCPICTGDTTPNDGVKGGTCEDGLRNGLTCDENADHPDFGPVSFDCPPSPGANISGSGLLLDLTFSSGAQSIVAALPTGAECAGSDDCHCSVCSGNVQIGCFDDAPCIAAGAGTCGSALANNPQQNNCDTTCTDDGDGNGLCDGPIDTFCDGFVRGNSNGIITCSVDADCDANDCNGDNALTPGECGACTLGGFRQCFLPTVSATGTPGIFDSEGVSVFCSGQTGNAGVDNAGGLPGPGRVKLDFDFNLYCADGTTPYQLPGGPTCP